jgi:hypothetical protein
VPIIKSAGVLHFVSELKYGLFGAHDCGADRPRGPLDDIPLRPQCRRGAACGGGRRGAAHAQTGRRSGRWRRGADAGGRLAILRHYLVTRDKAAMRGARVHVHLARLTLSQVEKHVAKAKRKPEDFPLPKQLSREKISEICEACKISVQHAPELEDLLDELVTDLRDWMPREKEANRRGDRDHIIDSRKRIDQAQKELKWLGIDGKLAVRSAAARLADIVSGDWLRYHFPGDAPSRTSQLRISRDIPRFGRDPDRDRDREQKHSNYQFIRYRAPETLRALLRDLESVLASALATLKADPRARGGRQPLEPRRHAIVNLAIIWRRIGKRVVGSPRSGFVDFCHRVFKAMGWRTRGLDSAILKLAYPKIGLTSPKKSLG